MFYHVALKSGHLSSDVLLGRGGSREDVLKIANGCLFLVEAKCQNADRSSLASYTPEAVSQAIALMMSTKYVNIDYYHGLA